MSLVFPSTDHRYIRVVITPASVADQLTLLNQLVESSQHMTVFDPPLPLSLSLKFSPCCAIRRAKPVLARLGIPLVDAGQIVEGQTWATRHNDGRHYHPLVPVELLSLMDAITAPMPSPLVPPQENAPAKPARDARARDESSGAEPEKSSFDLHGGSR